MLFFYCLFVMCIIYAKKDLNLYIILYKIILETYLYIVNHIKLTILFPILFIFHYYYAINPLFM